MRPWLRCCVQVVRGKNSMAVGKHGVGYKTAVLSTILLSKKKPNLSTTVEYGQTTMEYGQTAMEYGQDWYPAMFIILLVSILNITVVLKE